MKALQSIVSSQFVLVSELFLLLILSVVLLIVSSQFVLVPELFLLLILSVVLLAVYCPRAEENQRLRKIILAQHARIVELSEKSTAAQIDHERTVEAIKGEYIADIGELTSELAAQRGRAAQNASRADQIARAAERRSA